MTDLTEEMAEWLFDIYGNPGIVHWGAFEEDDKEEWREDAQRLLRFLSSLGLVQLDEDQTPPIKTNANADAVTRELVANFVGEMNRQGFRRVRSLLPQEKGK